MAAAVEMRAPLSLLYSDNVRDFGRHLPVPTGQSQKPSQKKVVRKSASMGAARFASSENEEPWKSSVEAKSFIHRDSQKAMGSAEPITEDVKVLEVNTADDFAHSRDFATSPAPTADDVASQTNVDATVGDEQDSVSVTQLEMEAMTWAAMAKDSTISALERRLRTALEIAKAEQDRNQELEKLLREARQSQEATAQELRDAKEQISELAEAEERLVLQLSDTEVEAFEEDQRNRLEIAALTEKIEVQDSLIAALPEQVKLGRSDVEDVVEVGSDRQSLAEQLEKAKEEIETLRKGLNDVSANVGQLEVQKFFLSRRLKTVEKERRQFLRKGTIHQGKTSRRY